jgi:phosphoglycolate phosphatase
MSFKAVLFDLDGTLIDTLRDIADSMNSALAELGFEPHPVDNYRLMVGDGTKVLAQRVLPEEKSTPETLSRLLVLMGEEYSRRWKDASRPYDGVEEMLAELKEQGILCIVLSNKDDHFTKQVVGHFFDGYPFAVVQGVNDTVLPKPDPAGAIGIIRKMQILPEEVLYLGDTNTDMKTAKAAGMYAVGASWGFRSEEELVNSGADIVIDRPVDLLNLL